MGGGGEGLLHRVLVPYLKNDPRLFDKGRVGREEGIYRRP